MTGCQVLQSASASCVTRTYVVVASCHCLLNYVATLLAVLQSGQNLADSVLTLQLYLLDITPYPRELLLSPVCELPLLTSTYSSCL